MNLIEMLENDDPVGFVALVAVLFPLISLRVMEISLGYSGW